MCPLSKMEVENTVKKYNRLLNCLDIGKDAYIAPRESERVLTNKEHGAFLKQEVLSLFNFDRLAANEKGFIGIGPIDDFDKIYNKIAKEFSIDSLDKQQLFSLRFDANGNDLRRNHMNIAFDCGDGPDKLFKEYTLIITPGSILDPGHKDKHHKTLYDAPIKEESSISEGVLKDLDLSTAVTSIKFSRPRGGKYEVEIHTSIPGYTNKTYTFDKQTYKPDDDVFKGNNVKNAFIKEHWKNPAKLPDIKMYVLAKELGDTMQAMWLKQAIDKSGGELPPGETAMLTSDKILFLRCLIHDIPCIIPEKGIPTLYQRERQGSIDMDSFKKKYIKDLEEKNRTVINEFKRFCRVVLYYRVRIIISGSGEIETKDQPQRKELSYFVESLVTRLENRLKIDIKEAQERAVGPSFENKKQYMTFIKECMMVSPFCRVDEAKNVIVFRAPSYKGIYPNSKDDKNMPIDIEYLYRKLKSKTDIGEEDYAKIFGDNTGISVYRRIKSQALGSKTTMAGGSNPNLEELATVYSANKTVSGFTPYFCLTHLYELMYIGYAYALALNIPADKYKTLFDGETMEKICTPFGKLGLDMVYEVNGNSNHYDGLLMGLLQIVKLAYTARNDVCIFNVVTPDIEWFLSNMAGAKDATLPAEVHLLAMEYYQALYEAEFSLICMNERDTKNPTDKVVDVKPAPSMVVEGPATPKRNVTRKRGRLNSGQSVGSNSGQSSMSNSGQSLRSNAGKGSKKRSKKRSITNNGQPINIRRLYAAPA